MTKVSFMAAILAVGVTLQLTTTTQGRTDWNPLVTAASILLIALAAAVPGLMAYFTAKQAKVAAAAAEERAKDVAEKAVEATKGIMAKVDGNFSDLKAEVATAKADVDRANQRIAVLTERLITSTPAQAVVPAKE